MVCCTALASELTRQTCAVYLGAILKTLYVSLHVEYFARTPLESGANGNEYL